MKTLVLKTRDDIRTMTDPYRVDIIQVFRKNENKALTVKDIANAMGEVHGKVYYHIKKLEKIGAVKLDHTKSINGITAKYYVLDFSEMSIEQNGKNKDLGDAEYASTLNMIEQFFDNSKNECLKYYRSLDDEKKLKMKPGEKSSEFQNTNLYFTEKSFKEFKSEIEEVFAKYKNKNDDDSEVYRKTMMLAVYSELYDE